ncbi:MAG: hypothetical protein KBS38_02440 [Bacteroidales bacterium]|nr:hypothetical protein [Candidatus Cacconaster caballi]
MSILSSISNTDESDGEGRAFNVDGIKVIDLHGNWHQMGRQYGILAAEQMKAVLGYLYGKIGSDPAKAESAADISDKLYANYPPFLKDYLDGVCETSALSLEQVKLCNAVEYVEGVFLCSAMAVWGAYGTGKLVFGRNYDAESYREIDREIVVTVYHPDGGIALATVGYAGELYCVNGMNAKGLFVEFNNGMPSAGAEIHWDLCPSTTGLFNMLLSAASLDDADSFFRNTQSALSATVGVADKNEARSYEWCHNGVRRGDSMTPSGLMISTNHYVNDGWHFPTPADGDSWNSITRRCNMADRAEECKGLIDVDRMKKIMSTSLENGGPMHTLTRYQIVAVPEDMVMHIFLPYIGKWVELRMKEYLG